MGRCRALAAVTVLAMLALAVGACDGVGGVRGSAGPSEPPTGASAPTPDASSAHESGDLTVYGAASLKDALVEVQAAYAAARPGTSITISTDSSAALEAQIEQGAPADVFLSADLAKPQKLVDAGLTAGPVTPFAGNLLTVIVPSSNPAGIRGPADLARTGVKVIAAGDAVPITTYATQLVANLAHEPGYQTDFASRYEANVVSREDNVAAVVSKVALGEADAAIVYITDARASDAVRTIAVPAAANVPATYGGVVIGESARARDAGAFLGWLAGPDGQAILASFGFLPPG